MKIGLVVDHFDPSRGGVETWTYQLAERLLRLAHEVHVVAETFNHSLDLPKTGDSSGLIWHRLPAGTSRMRRGHAAETILRRLDLDVIHDMGVGWFCDVFHPHGGSRTAAFRQNLELAKPWLRPWKNLAARILPRYREFDRLLVKQYGGSHFVIALSKMVQLDIREYHEVDRDRIRLVYNGVNIRRFSSEDRATHREPVRSRLGLSDELLFLIVAHNYRLKGVPTLLQAMSLLKQTDDNIHLAIVGGKQPRPFIRMARRLGVEQHVSFLGATDDIVPYYAAADVYVQPTFYDPCSLVVLEALGCGLPVITSGFNGASELMEHGKHGFIVDDPGDAITLSHEMSKLRDEQVREKMSHQCRSLSLRHTFTNNVDNILAVYREVIESRLGKKPYGRAAA